MNTVTFVLRTSLITYVASNYMGPIVVMLTVRNPERMGVALIYQLVVVRVAAFLLTGFVVGSRVTRRPVACGTIVGILLAVALFLLDVFTHFLAKGGRVSHFTLQPLWIIGCTLQIPVAMLGAWAASWHKVRDQ